ncbi:MAG: hypothetical protein KGL59_08940 [Acidobacteriota bacterium]|nr:hypothetical protein [Acidobacteriota bacterium]
MAWIVGLGINREQSRLLKIQVNNALLQGLAIKLERDRSPHGQGCLVISNLGNKPIQNIRLGQMKAQALVCDQEGNLAFLGPQEAEVLKLRVRQSDATEARAGILNLDFFLLKAMHKPIHGLLSFDDVAGRSYTVEIRIDWVPQAQSISVAQGGIKILKSE